ncbi:uncharacterized protein LOC111711953 [Eurytemora carolleeae]|uniref:uncharacterized protein LOC111711953 n=1 Tax=Eurytemora carolleeae TaxID=1294199 RepID=UPI000C78DCD8|nr:uncharacterized protein LOC111711953 [Eurytemora carolleeae]|eukprot:XP_023342211.1 uncharacterized protein LOC111711953 [Eurytemora affinis]
MGKVIRSVVGPHYPNMFLYEPEVTEIDAAGVSSTRMLLSSVSTLPRAMSQWMTSRFDKDKKRRIFVSSEDSRKQKKKRFNLPCSPGKHNGEGAQSSNGRTVH